MSKKLLTVKSKGSFENTFSFFNSSLEKAKWEKLWKYGEMGVQALRNATPVDTGLTRDSWKYEIERTKDQVRIVWSNTNVVKDYFNVAIMLQYGHATRGGGYVEGIDYINPALKPIFQQIADDLWNDTIGG